MAAFVHGLRQRLQPVEGEPDVLETDVVETGVADLVVDLEGVLDGNVVVGEHEDELGHRLIPSLFPAACAARGVPSVAALPSRRAPCPASRRTASVHKPSSRGTRAVQNALDKGLVPPASEEKQVGQGEAVAHEMAVSQSPAGRLRQRPGDRAHRSAPGRRPPRGRRPELPAAATIWPSSDRCRGQSSRKPSTRGRSPVHRSSFWR